MSKRGWIILLIIFIVVLCVSSFLVFYGVKKYHDDNSNKEIDRVLYIVGGVLIFISAIIIGLSTYKLVSIGKNKTVMIDNQDMSNIEMPPSRRNDMESNNMSPPYLGPQTPIPPPEYSQGYSQRYSQGYPPPGYPVPGFQQGYLPPGYPFNQ
jgi:hypothetical protein